MKPIQETLNRWINDNDTFKQRHATLKSSVLKDSRIRTFLKEHPEITDAHIERRLNKLYEFVDQSVQCDKCESLEKCHNTLGGYSPKLDFRDDDIHLAYEKCQSNLLAERTKSQENLMSSLYVPKEILHASMDNLAFDKGRVQAIKEIDAYLDAAKTKLPGRGLYLTGPFGVGKTYFLGAIANELRKLNLSSMIMYTPEFVSMINQAIQTDTVTEKMDQFKTIDVLMIDDIGAVTFSAWFRDDVLGSILQYRMMENLPVFFTSNFTMNQLEEVLATTTKGNVDQIKAGRIMERIRQVSKEIPVGGINRRKH